MDEASKGHSRQPRSILWILSRGRFIERIMSGGSISVKVTPKGFAEVSRLSSILQKCIDSSPSHVDLEGVLVSGMGEGAYYMGLEGYTRQFKSKIGYVPFPGTLNVRLDERVYLEARRQLDGMDGVTIDGFSDGQRTYGWVMWFFGSIKRHNQMPTYRA